MPVISAARPYPYEFPRAHLALLVIDMQRDFIEPGGFGSALGNDVSRLAAIVPPTARLLAGFRRAGLHVCHTKEAHRPDLADCPPAKLRRGNAALRIGDQGPMGRVLISGEPGNDFVAALYPRPGEFVVEKPGKGAFFATGLDALLGERRVTHLAR
jgi:nicotinamidase-related amidase